MKRRHPRRQCGYCMYDRYRYMYIEYIDMYKLCGIFICCIQLLQRFLWSFGIWEAASEISLLSISDLIIPRRRVNRKHNIKLETETAMRLAVDGVLSWTNVHVCMYADCREHSMIRPGCRRDPAGATYHMEATCSIWEFFCLLMQKLSGGARCDKAKASGNLKCAKGRADVEGNYYRLTLVYVHMFKFEGK